MKKITLCALGIFTFVSLSGCGEDNTTKESAPAQLRLAHGLSDRHPMSMALNKFADSVNKNSDGRYTIEVFGNGQLGDQRILMELVQSGVLDFGIVYAAVAENIHDPYKIFSTPYVFKDEKHYITAIQGNVFRDKLFRATADKGFITLTYLEIGVRSLYSRVKPIVTPADVVGQKFRVTESQNLIKFITLIGGLPVVLPFGETYTALQQGMVDGSENNPTALYTARHGEVAKYFSLTEHLRIPDLLLMSSALWDKLSEEDKSIFVAAADDARDFYIELWSTAVIEELEKAKKELGVKVNTADIKSFKTLVAPLHLEISNSSPTMIELFDYLKSIE